MEKSIIEMGQPQRSVITTCAYCGVGCSFEAELQGDRVVRMTPHKDGKANHGHSCVKGRFAWGYATHKDRITKPMIACQDHRSVARGLLGRGDQPCRLRIQAHPGEIRPRLRSAASRQLALHQRRNLPGAEADPRGVRQQQRRYLRARLPFADRLRPQETFGTSAGTQDFDSVDEADVVLVIGANPTDAHPVFASRMKRRLRDGAKLIVVDPRKIDLVRMPHVEASITCR
jgi:formate dehydrogenase major subunit